MDKIEPELLRNGAVVNLLNVIDHHQMLSVIELLKGKFAFKEIGYAIEQGVIAFNRPNPRVNIASIESANRSTVNSLEYMLLSSRSEQACEIDRVRASHVG